MNTHPIRSIEIWDHLVEFDRIGLESVMYRPSDGLIAFLEQTLAERMGVEDIRAKNLKIYVRRDSPGTLSPIPVPNDINETVYRGYTIGVRQGATMASGYVGYAIRHSGELFERMDLKFYTAPRQAILQIKRLVDECIEAETAGR